MSAASAEDGARWFLAFFGLVAGILCLAASAMSFAGGDAGLGAVFAAVCIACFLLAFLLRRSLRRVGHPYFEREKNFQAASFSLDKRQSLCPGS